MPKVWGIHNDTLDQELLDGGFVSVAWDDLGDLSQIGGGREGLKAALEASGRDAKKQAIANWAGILLRFRDLMQIGDVVVAPYKPDSTINIGASSVRMSSTPRHLLIGTAAESSGSRESSRGRSSRSQRSTSWDPSSRPSVFVDMRMSSSPRSIWPASRRRSSLGQSKKPPRSRSRTSTSMNRARLASCATRATSSSTDSRPR